jgi:hypothetical protein
MDEDVQHSNITRFGKMMMNADRYMHSTELHARLRRMHTTVPTPSVLAKKHWRLLCDTFIDEREDVPDVRIHRAHIAM